jgi:hypothetical protein
MERAKRETAWRSLEPEEAVQELHRLDSWLDLQGWTLRVVDKMLKVAEWARKYHVPFGANIIAGHPGETEASLRNSAAFMRKLFLDPKGTLGFLSVDPFRLYPGSPIADDLHGWQTRTGLQPHRYPWWEDGDQDFLAEWLAPSHDLTYARRHALTYELFAPIVTGLRDNFRYQGPAADYFERAVTSQVDLFTPERKSRNVALQALWTHLRRASARARAERNAKRRRARRYRTWHRARGAVVRARVSHVGSRGRG